MNHADGSRADADSRAGHGALYDAHEGAKLRLSGGETEPEARLARVVALLAPGVEGIHRD